MDSRSIYLQTLYNGRVELELALSQQLERELSGADRWLSLQEPSHSWPAGMERRFRFPAVIHALAVVPPGSSSECRFWLAVGCNDGSIHVCDLRTGGGISPGREGPRLSWLGNKHQVWSLSWSCESCLASGGSDGVIAVWDVRSIDHPLWSTRGHSEVVRTVVWGVDGYLASGSHDGTIAIWAPGRSNEPVWRAQASRSWVSSTAWGPEGLLASGSDDGMVAVWEPQGSQELIWRGGGLEAGVCSVSWCSDGHLAAGCRDGSVTVWLPRRREQPVWRGTHHGAGVSTVVAWTFDGYLVSGADDGSVAQWSVPSLTVPSWIGLGHEDAISCVVPGAEGQIVSGSSDHTVAVWKPGQDLDALWAWEDFHSGDSELGMAEFSAAWNTDGCLATSHINGDLLVWEAPRADPLWISRDARRILPSPLAWSQDGRLADCGDGDTIRVWAPLRQANPLWCWPYCFDVGNVFSLAWSREGQLAAGGMSGTIAAGGMFGTIAVWEKHSRKKPMWIGRGSGRCVQSISWGPGGRIAGGTDDGAIMVWEPNRGSDPVWCVERSGRGAEVAWCPSGHLVSGHESGTVSLWQPEGGPNSLWSVHVGEWAVDGGVKALACDPKGLWVAVGTACRRVLVLDTVSGATLARYETNAGVSALRWAPDSREIWAADNGAGFGCPRVYKLQLEGFW
jgi:WD40 repeat protein